MDILAWQKEKQNSQNKKQNTEEYLSCFNVLIVKERIHIFSPNNDFETPRLLLQ